MACKYKHKVSASYKYKTDTKKIFTIVLVLYTTAWDTYCRGELSEAEYWEGRYPKIFDGTGTSIHIQYPVLSALRLWAPMCPQKKLIFLPKLQALYLLLLHFTSLTTSRLSLSVSININTYSPCGLANEKSTNKL